MSGQGFIERGKATSWLIVATFLTIFIVGIGTYEDYDIFGDAAVERISGFITYEYINDLLFHREVPVISARNLPELPEWRDRQYGMFFQLPIIFIEDLKGFKTSFYKSLINRHLYCFIIYFIALICFYFTLKEILANKLIALAGVLMEHLHYNLYAQSITNIKDGLFVSIYIIACFFMIKLMKNREKNIYLLLFSLFTALATTIRFYGFILIPTYITYAIVEDIVFLKSNNNIKSWLNPRLKRGLTTNFSLVWLIIIFCTIYYIVMPVYWLNPGKTLLYTINSALNFPNWNDTMEFMGKVGKWEDMPWYYLPVYMLLTIPVYTIIAFLIGTILIIFNTFRGRKFENFVRYRFLWVYMGLFFILFIFQIVFHIKIYGRWRHMYILYPAFVVIAAAGIQMLQEIVANSKVAQKSKYILFIIPLLMSLGFLGSIARMIKNHPYEQAMYNIIGMKYGAENNRAGHGRKEIYSYMLEHDNSEKLKVKFEPVGLVSLNSKALKRITWVINDYDYLFVDYRNIIGNTYQVPGYSEIYTLWQDGYKLASLYKKNP